MSEWQTIILTAIITTVGTILVSFFSHRMTTRSDNEQDRKRNARYLAIRVVSVLEPFISECVDVAHDSGALNSEGTLEPSVPVPDLHLPTDVDWRCVEPDFMYRALSLPNRKNNSDHAIEFYGSMLAGPPDFEEYYWERKIRYAQLGLETLELVEDLREAYGISQGVDATWDRREALEHQLAKTEKTKVAYQAQIDEFVEGMSNKKAEQSDGDKP